VGLDGPKESCVRWGVQIPLGKRQFLGKREPILKYRETLHLISVVMPFGLLARSGSRNHELNGSPDPPWEGQLWGKGSPIVNYWDLVLWAVQKRLHRSICRLGCGLGWAEGSTSSIVFTRWRQYASNVGTLAPPGEYDWTVVCGLDWSVAAMRFCVKLLWPLVIILPSVLLHCCLDIRKSIKPVKNWAMRCWRGYLSVSKKFVAFCSIFASCHHSWYYSNQWHCVFFDFV